MSAAVLSRGAQSCRTTPKCHRGEARGGGHRGTGTPPGLDGEGGLFLGGPIEPPSLGLDLGVGVL